MVLLKCAMPPAGWILVRCSFPLLTEDHFGLGACGSVFAQKFSEGTDGVWGVKVEQDSALRAGGVGSHFGWWMGFMHICGGVFGVTLRGRDRQSVSSGVMQPPTAAQKYYWALLLHEAEQE